MIRLIFRLNENWVHRHSARSRGPVREIVRFIEAHKTQSIQVEKAAPSSLSVSVDETAVDWKILAGDVAGFLADHYKISDQELERILRIEVDTGEGPCSVRIGQDDVEAENGREAAGGPEDAQESAGAGAGDPAADDPDEPDGFGADVRAPGQMGKEAGGEEGADEEEDFFHLPVNPDNLASILEAVQSMGGADQFYSLCQEIHQMAPILRERELAGVVTSRNYLFSMDEGYGLTDCLTLLTALLSEERLFHAADIPITTELLPENENADVLAPVAEAISQQNSRIVSIDISAWLGNEHAKAFRDFLAVIAENRENLIYVFRVPFMEENMQEKLLDVLNDAMRTVPVTFLPMSTAQLEEAARQILQGEDFAADDRVWEMFRQRIAREKSDGRFYGMRTLKKIVADMIYLKVRSMALGDRAEKEEGQEDPLLIRPQDLPGFVREELVCDPQASPEQMLDDLVCTARVREDILAMLAAMKADQEQKGESAKPLYISFCGSFGTGKTTVARVLGRLLHKEGLLADGCFFEHGAGELLDCPPGFVPTRLSSMVRDAAGSVLFLDELCRLTDPVSQEKEQAREAIRELAALLKSPDPDMVLILAGEPGEFKKLSDADPAFASAIPYTLHFRDYDRAELTRTFLDMLRERRIEAGEGLEQAVESYFTGLDSKVLDSDDFSNARFVRNLFESARSRSLMRARVKGTAAGSMEKEDFAAASSRAAGEYIAKKSRHLQPGYHLGLL